MGYGAMETLATGSPRFWVFTQRTEKLSVPTPTPFGPPGPQSSSTAASQRCGGGGDVVLGGAGR